MPVFHPKVTEYIASYQILLITVFLHNCELASQADSVYHTCSYHRDLISLPSPRKEICQSLRELILENFPHMREELKWNSPAYSYHGKRSCLTSGFKDHVTVELFYGAHLEDAQARIVGAGKNTRHMKLQSLQDIDTKYLVDLLQQSIELSQAGHYTA